MKVTKRNFKASVLPPPPLFKAARFRSKWLDQPAFASGRDDWFGEIVPTEPQELPSCAFRSAAQMIMALIRREHGPKAIPKGKILDGDWLYRNFCDRTRGGDYTQGAQLDDGIKEAVRVGWIGGKGIEYGIAAVPWEPDYLDKMLRVTPLLCGFAITNDWFKADRETGQIPMGGLPNLQNGHAVILVDIQELAGVVYGVIANSWGVDDWGRHGYGVLTLGQMKQQALMQPLALYLPKGTGIGWKNHLMGAE